MKLVLCIAFVNLNTWKCTWICPVSLVNGVLSHYCTCLKGYLAIVVLGRTGAASVAAHFRTYFRWQEKTTTCLCQRSSIVLNSVEETVITCVCVCKEGPQPFCSEKGIERLWNGCACVRRLTFIRALEVEQGTVLSGQRTPFYITFVT